MCKNTQTSLLLILLCSSVFNIASAQTPLLDTIKSQREHYIETHDVFKADEKKYLRFFPPDTAYSVIASFKPVANGKWFTMETTGAIKKTFRQYGLISFVIKGEEHRLFIYQSQGLMTNPTYKDYLFLPFTDATNGNETYEVGRYLDFKTDDIKDGKLKVDFNMAYNPSCAYVSGKFNCPIPPKDNSLTFDYKTD